METVIVIPARMQSKRLPGKPLLMAGGKSLLQHVYERACQAKVDRTIIATPDGVIMDHCDEIGMTYMMTRKDHPTGTHRCAEVLHRLEMTDKEGTVRTIVNWQCDEPLVEPEWADKLLDKMAAGWAIGTLVAPLPTFQDEWELSKGPVRVAVSREWCCWFSHSLLAGAMAHVGIYAFRPRTLRGLGKLLPTELSKAESLEQLAWIENGHSIKAVKVDKPTLAINTPADYEKFREMTFDANC